MKNLGFGMLRRALSIILAVLLVASLAACGNHSQADTKETQVVTEEQEESAESTAEAAPIWRHSQAAVPGWKENGSAETYRKKNCRPGLKV